MSSVGEMVVFGTENDIFWCDKAKLPVARRWPMCSTTKSVNESHAKMFDGEIHSD